MCIRDRIDVGGGYRRELHLRLLRCLLETLHGHPVLAQIDTLLFLEFISHVIHDPLVEVVASEAVVATGGQDLDHVVAQFQQGDVKGAAPEVKNKDLLLPFFIEAVSKSRRGRFIDCLLYTSRCV